MINSQSIQKGKWLSLIHVNYTVGSLTAEREFTACGRGAAAIMVSCPIEEKVLLVKQFRYPVFHNTQDEEASYTWEVVAGMVDKDEDPKDTMIRELHEEAAIEITKGQIVRDIRFYTSPGISSEIITMGFVFLGSITEASMGGLTQEGESTAPQWLSYSDVKDMIRDGKICDGKTLLALATIGITV